MKRLPIILSALILAAAVIATETSCNTSGCSENRSAVPLAEFCNSSTGETVALDSVAISGVDAPADSVLSPAGRAVSQVYLPMRPTKPSVRWCLAYRWKALDDPRLNDTISIDYDSQPYFSSEECGAYYRYRITSLRCTGHLIDSVGIVDSLITNVDKTYLKIYFRVAQE